ncbi:MAG: tetraacyldisaccharide 4'-kinase [Planctomycetes bacterium]|nr:tetraacyldisaccharide 4'-kinase [Planctomycetota bacterium]
MPENATLPMDSPELPAAASVRRRSAYLKLIRGETVGAAATAERLSLSGLSWCYRVGVGIRNALYDGKWFRTHLVDAAVISVGNLTAGGTGKTPMVEWIARWIRKRGYRVAVLSRGYGQRPSPSPAGELSGLPPGIHDEGLLLQANLDGVHLILGPDRLRGARTAMERLQPPPECFLLDDGFQHRRLHRDLDILLIDALNPFGYGHLLPRGLLREPVQGMRRADLIVLTRADQAGPAALDALHERIGRLAPRTPILTSAHRVKEVLQCPDLSPVGMGWLKQKRVLAFCALGNPEGFRRAVQDLNVILVGFCEYPDHHWYTGDDLLALVSEARRLGADALLTTQKDAVKFQPLLELEMPLLCLRIGIEFLRGAGPLTERLTQLFPETRSPDAGMSPEELAQSVSLGGRPEEPRRPWAERWWEARKRNCSGRG